ncbi:carbohydrate kinase [Aurantibacter crassamenti]|uniref:carbohydrate kinase family protein n=1 Tax=Aurantibacter crassamenti TaxID=1837375 RepID=UPI00193951FA|nr:carbohydrate kinase [Aurantibacter crassamenti]MBM1104947.1 carbohydrate kinase [Aurantibacter crassamenti]
MKEVFCIGELLIDFVAEKQGNDLSLANIFTKKAGGAPANVACAIAKLDGKSSFIGCVGNDQFGDFLLRILEEYKVDLSLAQRSKTFTTLAFVSISDDGERDFVFSRGADKELQYDPAIKKSFKDNLVHFGAATALLGGNLEDAYSHYLFDALTKNSFISFDPNFREDLWKDDAKTFIKKCKPFIEKSHLCKFSLEEAQLLSGKAKLEDACDYFHETGVPLIVVTLGGEGTYVSAPNLKKTIGSIPVEPVDTTGAGDAFIGCLLRQISSLADPKSIITESTVLEKMIEIANKAGAITTTNFGAIPSLPSTEQIF